MKRPIRANEVRVVFEASIPCLRWLNDRNLRADEDWGIDLHRGERDYTSFFFAEERLAIEFKLTFG
jgi:hypothetical protein